MRDLWPGQSPHDGVVMEPTPPNLGMEYERVCVMWREMGGGRTRFQLVTTSLGLREEKDSTMFFDLFLRNESKG